jgi:hypothetical protein
VVVVRRNSSSSRTVTHTHHRRPLSDAPPLSQFQAPTDAARGDETTLLFPVP